MAFKRGPLSDEKKQAIRDGMARRKGGAPTKKQRAASAKMAKMLTPTLTPSGALRRQQCVHRYPGDGSNYLTFREIGEELGVTKNAVNLCYNRAVRKIAEEVVKMQTLRGLHPAIEAVNRIMSMPELEEMIIEALQSSAVQLDHRKEGYTLVS